MTLTAATVLAAVGGRIAERVVGGSGGCRQHATAATGDDVLAWREFGPAGPPYSVARGVVGGVRWQVLVGADAGTQTVELVVGGKEWGGQSGTTLAADQWNFDRTASGDWIYGPGALGARRVRAVLRGGQVATACAVFVPGPLNEPWFAIAVPTNSEFDNVEVLTGDGHRVLQHANVTSSLTSPRTRNLFATSVTPSRP